jgi:dTDP-4-dehydrorhamnose 3,5-epimerase
MELSVKSLRIEGLLELSLKPFHDERGSFVKTYHKDVFTNHGIGEYFVEEFFTISKQRVLRGMHFQLPPFDHSKLVYCTSGEALDVVVDLRKQSPTYSKVEQVVLDSKMHNMLYIPKGFAHGFYTLSESATMVYKVSSVHSPQHDTGILWNSIDFAWPDQQPIVSSRDRSLIPFQQFQSPF